MSVFFLPGDCYSHPLATYFCWKRDHSLCFLRFRGLYTFLLSFFCSRIKSYCKDGWLYVALSFTTLGPILHDIKCLTNSDRRALTHFSNHAQPASCICQIGLWWQLHERLALAPALLSGIAMLTFALLMSARMGIFQETLYKKYGKHPKEALFYNVSFPFHHRGNNDHTTLFRRNLHFCLQHCLPLPGFLLLSTDIYNYCNHFSQSSECFEPFRWAFGLDYIRCNWWWLFPDSSCTRSCGGTDRTNHVDLPSNQRYHTVSVRKTKKVLFSTLFVYLTEVEMFILFIIYLGVCKYTQ